MCMKTIIGAILCTLAISFDITAQCTPNGPNLIPNPSFESFGVCPVPPCGFPPEIRQNSSPCTSWRGIEMSCPMGSTPDFTKSSAVAVPTCASTLTVASGNEMCLNGNYCVGLFVFVAPDGSNTREYVQCQLNSTLIAGQTYCFSMVAKTRAGGAGNQLNNTNGLGAFFHNLGIIDIDVQNGATQFLGPGSTINATPQVQASALIPHNSCSTIQGTFVATGTERYLTIGNFRTDATTTKTSTSASSYMYIDDLKLYPINPLPVELSSFSASCNESVINLQWVTESEYQNDHFTIERSCNGVDYEKIGTLNGNGTTNQATTYTFNDSHSICDGIIYYRLSQTDIDGRTVLLPIISTMCSQTNSTIVSVDMEMNALYIDSKESLKQLGIYDCTGKLILASAIDEKTPFTVDLPPLSSGIYFVRILTAFNEIVTHKLFISK
jgi:hypothetical protein